MKRYDYLVVYGGSSSSAPLTSVLDKWSAQGYRLHTLVPTGAHNTHWIATFEREFDQ